MNKYECLFIINPDAASERFAAVAATIAKDVERFGGTIEKTEEIGQKVLCYPIAHCNEGFYYQINFSMPPAAVSDFKRRCVLNADVLRYLIQVTEK
ncbi:30S ribosomal protein S6 [bacterium]|nr:30S ribosomal protein S6 [bacterium]